MKLLNKIPPALPKEEQAPVKSLVNKVVLVDGVETLQLCEVEDVTVGLKASDFGLQQLITAGATDLLKPCPKMTSQRVDIADNIETTIETFQPEYEPNEPKE